MAMKTLDVPKTSISDVKKSPMDAFNRAEEAHSGVYVFNRDKVAGVMLTQDQYEDLNHEVESLHEQLIDLLAVQRLADTTTKTYSDMEVRGSLAENPPVIDEHDGWE